MLKRSVVLAAVVVGMALTACASNRGYREAQIAEQFGDWDEAVLHYLELVDEYPYEVNYRTGLLRAKIRASQEHFRQAQQLQEAGALEQAIVEYRQAIQLDPTNQYAQVEFEKLREQMERAREAIDSPLSIEEMKERTQGSRPQPPVLNPRSTEPISLSFPKPVSVFDIYRSLGKAFGINVMFDPKLRDQQVAIELPDVVAQDSLEILMRTANHFYKVLDERTLIVVEDNPQNRRNYEDLVIQTFFLSNAEVKDVMTMLRSLVGAKNVAANDKLNAIVLRDTADKVKVAERIIQTNDKSRGEVVIDVELLQINTSKMRELGVSLSDYRVTQSLDPNPIQASELEFLNQSNWMLNLPAFIYDFVKNSADAQLLASPQLRISDGEQASLHIGDREPIPVTTFNTAQTVGGNIVPITSFQYQDVGIRLNIEPRLHHNREISLTLTVEVSQISGFREATGGQRQPIIGTRTIESTIRLRDGETNFLAGLIRTDESNSAQGVPGISEIPVLGRLFSKKSTTTQRTDLVLTMTPHIVRTPNITEQDLMPIWVGTEANITFRGGSPRVESEVEGPFDEGEEQDAQRIREMIRRRIQNLPRGLRDAGEEAEPAEAAPGVELVPGGTPTDLFRPPPSPPDDGGDDGGDGAVPVSLVYLPPDRPDRPDRPDGAERPDGADPEAPTGEAAAGATEAPSAPPAAPAQEAATPALSGDAFVPAAAKKRVKLKLLPRFVSVEAGELAELELVAQAGRAVAHLPVTLTFDPEILEFEEAVRGDFLGDEEAAEVLFDASRPGRLVVGASRLAPAEGVEGEGVVARFVFRAKEAGRALVRFDRKQALGADLGTLRLKTRAARIEVVAAGEDG